MKYTISNMPELSAILTDKVPFSFGYGEEVLEVELSLECGFKADKSDKGWVVNAENLGELMRGLGEVVATTENHIKSLAPMSFRAIMLDVSRNGATKVEEIEKIMVQLALLGMNAFCLYTEEMFEVTDEPLFGYGRGRYTKSDIKRLVEFSKKIGVEMFPCIQVLGHMEQILKYPKYSNIKDNDFIYNVYSDETYAFIEKTIDEALEPYETNFVHIGMDETHGLGLGGAFKEGEAIYPRQIYVNHLKVVMDIVERKNLKAAMWGDVVLGNFENDDAMSDEEINVIPKNVVMNYWNYHGLDQNKIGNDINRMKSLGFEAMVSPGAWNWSRFFPAYNRCAMNYEGLLVKARSEGVQKALGTAWGDDGQECLFEYTIPAHALFLSYLTGKGGEQYRADLLCSKLFGLDANKMRLLGRVDDLDPEKFFLYQPNTGKCYFYDDPILAYYAGLEDVQDASRYYQALLEQLLIDKEMEGEFSESFDLGRLFVEILVTKSSLRPNIEVLIKSEKIDSLGLVLDQASELKLNYQKFQKMYRKAWLKERRPYGLEVLEGRFGAQIVRLDSLIEILTQWAENPERAPEELTFQRYGWDYGVESEEKMKFPGYWLHFSQIHTRCHNKWW